MCDNKNLHDKNIDGIISIVKLASLLFCGIIAIKTFFATNNDSIMNKSYLNVIPGAFFVFTLIIIYCLWLFFSNKIILCKNRRTMQIVENSIFIFIFSTLIVISKTYIVEYKFLFLFIIITATLQLGMKQGMVMAEISSAIILIIDLLVFPNNGSINLYFENDLIIAGVFILTAWPLGYYVENEKKKIDKKNQQIEELGNELREQDKQRKDIEEKLLKNRVCYNLLIENSRDCILVHRDFKFLFVNESAVKLLEFSSPEELIGKSVLDITVDEIRNIVKEKFQKIYSEQTTVDYFEGKITNKSGKIIPIKNTSTYFLYEGKPTILSIISDITSEKRVEELRVDVEKNIQLLNETREFNKLITDFFSNISHELKTPLNVICSAIQMLNLNKCMEQDLFNKQDKYIKVIKQNCYRLTRLINNLLDLTRLDAGFLKLNLGNYNIISTVEDITLSIVEFANSKGIDVIFDTEVEEKIMTFDPDKIERIILNLLSNAIKFTGKGGEILVSIIDMEENIIISIKDTGVGIPEDKLDIIFDRFRQVEKTLKREHEGSGIGLSLVKYFVEMHEGTIDIKSKLGVGSEFIVNLPVRVHEIDNYETVSYGETNVERINIEFSDIYS